MSDCDDRPHCCGRTHAECLANPGPMCGGSVFPSLRPTPPGGTELERALADCVEAITRPALALPTDAAKRKQIPIVAGCLDYFPSALAAVAELSRVGNEQHNPGQPLHHARGKSTDHADCIVRHLMDRGTVDTDGIRHSAKVAWRALALLQLELEAAGAPLARGAKL